MLSAGFLVFGYFPLRGEHSYYFSSGNSDHGDHVLCQEHGHRLYVRGGSIHLNTEGNETAVQIICNNLCVYGMNRKVPGNMVWQEGRAALRFSAECYPEQCTIVLDYFHFSMDLHDQRFDYLKTKSLHL